jgi:fatty acid desaturase
MIENLPYSINLLFLVTAIFTIVFFWLSNKEAKKTTLLLIIWSILQLGIAFIGLYHNTEGFPPNFLYVIVPPFILIFIGINAKVKKSVVKHRSLSTSTLLHSVRLPVGLTLFYLFQHQLVPELMTFQGRNFDIIAGITAPFMSWLYAKNKLSNIILLTWNIFCLGLVLFVFINGILSARLPIQLLAFNQPTIALEYAPFVLLPALIVPVVVYTHLTDIIELSRLIKKQNRKIQVS